MSLPSAPLPARLASLLYETLLVFAVLAVLFAFPHVLVGVLLKKVATPGVLMAHVLLLLLLYFGWFWLHGGQTLAMRTWRIRVVAQDDSPLQLWQVILRYLLAWPCLIPGILWALIDRDGQFLHDRLAGTRLVRTEK